MAKNRRSASAFDENEKLAVKVYTDTLSPGAKAVGSTLGHAVRAALRPVDGLVWSLIRRSIGFLCASRPSLKRKTFRPAH